MYILLFSIGVAVGVTLLSLLVCILTANYGVFTTVIILSLIIFVLFNIFPELMKKFPIV